MRGAMAAVQTIDLAEARRQIDAWLEASAALASGGAHAMGDRSLTRADAGEVQRMLDYWTRTERELLRAARGAGVLDPARAVFRR